MSSSGASPFKRNFTAYSGERCIYHSPSRAYYTQDQASAVLGAQRAGRRDACRCRTSKVSNQPSALSCSEPISPWANRRAPAPFSRRPPALSGDVIATGHTWQIGRTELRCRNCGHTRWSTHPAALRQARLTADPERGSRSRHWDIGPTLRRDQRSTT